MALPIMGVSQEIKSRPNIVFILIDDLRHDVFSFCDHPFIETPNIDRLARQGVHFRNAFVTTSLCSPSRASFLTGRYMHHHKVVDNADTMPAGTLTFPQLLQAAGYQTSFIGKWHMGGSSDSPRPGFDHWVSFRGQGTYAPDNQRLNVNGQLIPRKTYMTDELTDCARDWISQQKANRPFLLYLSHKGVHGFYEPASRHLDHYSREKIVLPQAAYHPFEPNDGKPMWVLDQRNSWHGVEFPYYGRSKQTLKEMYQHYCEMILSIDESVGHLLNQIEQSGLDENTLIFFTSDGGHLWGEHGLIDKRCAYEESIRIPLLVHGPGNVLEGHSKDQIVSNIDVAPTLLEFAGLPKPNWMDGDSFFNLLTGKQDPDSKPRELLYEYYWEPQYPQTPTTFCIRNNEFKFIQYHGIWDTDELYDLQSDPGETRNLIDHSGYQDIVRSMRVKLYEKLKKTGGLMIPLGSKRNHGSNLRNPSGTTRTPFPTKMLSRPLTTD